MTASSTISLFQGHTKKRFKKSSFREAGYTLFEIMLVLGIISVLVGSAIYMLAGNIDVAKEQRVQSDIQAISMQLRTYEMLNYRKPTTEQGLRALVDPPSADPRPQRWKRLMEAVPLDPWGNEYVYRNPGKYKPESYDLYSLGPQGKEGEGTLVTKASSVCGSKADLKRASFKPGFTLLEVLIALALVAILMLAGLPYMKDALTKNEGETIIDFLTTLIEKTRLEAISSGEAKYIDLTELPFLPKGWTLQVEGMNDRKFHAPDPNQLWEINTEGLCAPMTLRLLGTGEPLTIKIDPITGQVVHEE